MKDKRHFLFDIDGTLITTGGAGGAAMRSAFASIYGLDDAFKSIEFSGRSDFAIFEDALRLAGVSEARFKDAMRKFKRVYYRHLPLSLQKHEGRVLPGVEALQLNGLLRIRILEPITESVTLTITAIVDGGVQAETSLEILGVQPPTG